MQKIVITGEELLHAIATIGYVAADIREGKDEPHALHQVADICQEGNVDRVANILSLAFSIVEGILSPVIEPTGRKRNIRSRVSVAREYVLCFGEKCRVRAPLLLSSPGRLRRLCETVREFMIAMVMAEWFSLTLSSEWKLWRDKAETAREALASQLASACSGAGGAITRPIPPI